MKRLYTFGLLLFLPFLGYSQGENNNWYFSEAAVTFNSGSPVVIPPAWLGGSVTTASVSDSSGNLLFYSDGSQVYNRLHLPMPNGLININGSGEQTVLAIKKPHTDSLYYLFTTNSFLSGLSYSVIDMRLDGGLGDIVPGMKNLVLPDGADANDGIHTTRHRNNKDTWVVVRKSNKYGSYLVDTSGIHNPVISNSTLVTPVGQPNGAYIKISRDGTKLLANVWSAALFEYCNFNKSTGVITPLFTFKPYLGIVNKYSIWGSEFSRSTKYLYVTTQNTLPPFTTNSWALFQYDATKTDSAGFMQSQVLIDTIGPNYEIFGLQLAPDEKIYGCVRNLSYLCAIDNPEAQGIACNFQPTAVNLTPNFCYDNLPQVVQKYYVYIKHTGLCVQDLIHFSTTVWPPVDSIHWDFGDPGSGGLNYSNLPSPLHSYSSPGSFMVTLIVRHNDNRMDTGIQVVTVSGPVPALGPDRTVCSGDSLMLDAGACAGCTYVWDNLTGGLMNISNNQIYYAKTNGNFRVTVTATNGCSGSDSILVTLTPKPQVTNNPSSKSICSGDSTKIALTSNVNGTTFNWTATLTSGTVTGFSADSGWILNQVLTNTGATPGMVTYHITPRVGSCIGDPVDYAVTVTPGIPVTVSITATSLAVCSGTQVTFSASPTNQGSSPVYLWKVNSVTVGTNSDTYTYLPANGDVVYCVLTSSNTVCVSNNPATSNSITMTVTPNLPVNVTVSASQNPSCAGTPVHFTAAPTNGGLTPHYQWKVNGGTVGFDSTVYTYIPVNGDLITCILTSSELCTTNNPASSIQYPASVSNNLPVSVTISASQNPFCAGSSVSFTATPTNGGTTPSYLWKVNGFTAGINSPNYTYFPINGDLVSCTLTSSEPCISGNPASSIQIQMLENNGLPAGVTISASSNPFCPGAAVTFSATPSNGGGNPTYLWKVNGATVGGSTSSYTYNPATGDSVRCIMQSNLACVTGNPASSAKIIMSGTLAPIVSFTPCFDTVTTLNAKPIKLKGGIPLGGTYSGPGVNPVTGVFTPSLAGLGTKTITYTYTNASLCSSISHLSIVISPSSLVNCGNNLTDIRDGKIYSTVQIGTQCWLAEDLNYGTEIPFSQYQRDNCLAEKYHNPASSIQHPASVYQWDELMFYDDTPADQGLCPPAWHVPTENDWLILFSNYTNSAMAASALKYSGYSGFNALLSGANHLNHQWDYSGFATFYWSSTSHGPIKAWAYGLNDPDPSVSSYPSARTNAFSVRCIKD